MIEQNLLALLTAVAKGQTTPENALQHLKIFPAQQTLDGVTPDFHRQLRTGLGEVIFAQGKNETALCAAFEQLAQDKTPTLATRVSSAQSEILRHHFPSGEWWPDARLFCIHKSLRLEAPYPEKGNICILSAGSADIPVALEALGTAHFYDIHPAVICDVGVAGIHRLSPHLATLQNAQLHIVVAGMEGALPSVIAGLCGRPVIAVPTSVGYGAGAGGITPLLAMLNSCAAGVSVMNIDNGYGAAVFAAKLMQTFSTSNG